ncbi:hypothetical protein FHG87_020663 [Trinorchestia longiramus]|nr:hypothetical protein FHG87_020663 [Trinorchestia longiramus]
MEAFQCFPLEQVDSNLCDFSHNHWKNTREVVKFTIQIWCRAASQYESALATSQPVLKSLTSLRMQEVYETAFRARDNATSASEVTGDRGTIDSSSISCDWMYR